MGEWVLLVGVRKGREADCLLWIRLRLIPPPKEGQNLRIKLGPLVILVELELGGVQVLREVKDRLVRRVEGMLKD